MKVRDIAWTMSGKAEAPCSSPLLAGSCVRRGTDSVRRMVRNALTAYRAALRKGSRSVLVWSLWPFTCSYR